MKDQIAEIVKLCLEITVNTQHDVFFEYSAHINEIEVRIHKNGWESQKDWESLGCDLDRSSEEDLNEIIEQLQELL